MCHTVVDVIAMKPFYRMTSRRSTALMLIDKVLQFRRAQHGATFHPKHCHSSSASLSTKNVKETKVCLRHLEH